MAFTDNFTGTDGDKLDGRTGWSLVGSEGLNVWTINPAGTGLCCRATGGGSGATVYSCTDQGSADHYTQITDNAFVANNANHFCVRLVDADNYCFWHLAGVGSAGSRMTKRIAGTETDLVTTQGASGDIIKIEAEGTTYRFYIDTGSGFSQIGTDQTISSGDLSSSETTQGCRSNILNTSLAFDDFEAGALGAGGATGKSNPIAGPMSGPLAGPIGF